MLKNRDDFTLDLSDINSNPIIEEIDAHKLMKSKENVSPNISFNVINPYPSTSKDSYPATFNVNRDPFKNSKLNTYTRAAKKSLQITVTRQTACNKCKNPTSLYNLVKCMACKKYYCDKCAHGQAYFDYICDFCFEG